MDLKIVQLFIRFCTAYALEQCNYNKENKHFSHSKQEQFLISLLEESLVIARFLLDAKTIISIYDALKGLYPGVDQPEKAIHCYENIRTFMSGTGEAEMNIDNRIGLFYHIKGESRKAIENQEKSLSIAKEIGHRRGQERAYACLGVAYHLSGEYQKSIECYEKAVNMAKVIGYRGEESNNYGKLGLVYFELGEYHKAFEYHEKRLSITKEIGDREGEGAAYQFLGVVYFALGEYHKAIEHYEKSLSIAKEIGDRLGEIDIYGNLGGAYRLLGEYHKAIQYHEKSLSIAKEADIMKQFKFEIYGSLGVDYASLGEHHKAIKYYKKSLSQAKKTGHRQGQGDAYGNLGIAYYFLGKYHKAIQYYEKSMIIHKETGDRLGQAGLHHNMGLVYEKESSIKDLNKSKEHLKKSIQCYKKIFDDLKDNDQFKVSIVDTFIKTYKFLSQVYIKTRQSEEALLVCEHGRARALIDFLFLKCNKTEKAKSKELELADVKTISSHREGCILFYSLHSNKVTYHSWVISSRSPFTFFYDETDNREALATIVSSLSEDEGKNTEAGYFQYLVDNCFQQLNVREGKGMKCENRSMNLLEHEDLECAPSTNSSQLSEIALKVFHKVDRCIPEEEGDDVEPLDMLFYRLVSPVLDQLIHDEVIIIPDGHLFMVPFAALQDPKTGKYLSETKRIRLAPSLTTLKILQESSHDQHDGEDIAEGPQQSCTDFFLDTSRHSPSPLPLQTLSAKSSGFHIHISDICI